MGRVPLPRPLLYPAGNSPPAPERYRTQRESDASKCEARELVTGAGEDVIKGGSLRNPRGQNPEPRTQNPEPVDLHGRGLGTTAALLSPLWGWHRVPQRLSRNLVFLSDPRAMLKPRAHNATSRWAGVPTCAVAVLGPNLLAMVRTGRVPREG